MADHRDGAAPLSLPPDEMRRLGYAAIDLVVDALEGLRERPAARIASADEMAGLAFEAVPEEGSPADEVLRRAATEVLPHAMRTDHPRFFGYVPNPSNFVGVVAETLATGFSVFAGTWQAASGPAAVELATLDWVRRLFGLPEGAGGLFTDGSSSANLLGLAVARRWRLDDDVAGAVAYASDQTHSCVARDLGVLGFRPNQLRLLAGDEALRLPLDALAAAVAADRAAGRRPFCVVANAGTTNTGAVDPLADVAAFCRAEGLWFHVDAAFGGAAVLVEEGRALLRGIDEADSVAFDAHKWWFQPVEAGCLLVRDVSLLEGTFSMHAEYLAGAAARDREVNFSDRGIQLTRSFRAFKLWMSLQVFGLDAFREAVRCGFDLARHAEARLLADPRFELVAPASIALVAFRCTPPGCPPDRLEALNGRVADAMLTDDVATLSSTTVRGRKVLRLCTVNPRSTPADVDAALDRTAELAAQEAAATS